MVNKKIFLGLLVVFSLFIFACEGEQQETLLNELDYEEVMDDDEAYEEISESVYEAESVEDFNDEPVQEEVMSDDEAEETVDESLLAEGITREEIAENNDENSCWVGYYGYVYDLTAWLNQHPGGAQEILPNCGTVEEFTEAYDNRHGQKDTLNRNEAIGELI